MYKTVNLTAWLPVQEDYEDVLIDGKLTSLLYKGLPNILMKSLIHKESFRSKQRHNGAAIYATVEVEDGTQYELKREATVAGEETFEIDGVGIRDFEAWKAWTNSRLGE